MNLASGPRLSVALLHAVAAGASNRRLLVWPEMLAAKYSTEVLFMPYLSADCIALHSAVAESLQRNGLASSAVCVVDPKSLGNQRNDRVPSAASAYYGDRISELADLAGDSHDIARGYVDQYRRTVPVDAFFDRRPLDATFVSNLLSLTTFARNAVSRAKVLVLPDLAYALNRSVAEFARQQGKRLFLLNPHGRFREVNLRAPFAMESDLSELFSSQLVRQLDESRAPAHQPIGDTSSRDWNVQAAMESANGELEIASECTTIFLHCVRDAGQDPISRDRLAEVDGGDLFQWTLGVLGAAARDPGSWLIKPHPSMDHYPGERAIVKRAISALGLEQRSLVRGPSRQQVIDNRLRVLTHTGTIALECAASGFKAMSTSSIFPSRLVKSVAVAHSSSLDSLKGSIVEGVNITDSQAATALLVESGSSDLPEPLLLDAVALPQRSRYGYLSSQLRNWRASRSRYSSVGNRKLIDKLGVRLVGSLTQPSAHDC